MKNKLLFIALLSFLVLVFNACKKDKCKMCSAEQVMYENGSEIMSQSISPQEVCNEDLKSIESNPVIESTQIMFGDTIKTITTYSCK